jgi:hypothetical protein
LSRSASSACRSLICRESSSRWCWALRKTPRVFFRPLDRSGGARSHLARSLSQDACMTWSCVRPAYPHYEPVGVRARARAGLGWLWRTDVLLNLERVLAPVHVELPAKRHASRPAAPLAAAIAKEGLTRRRLSAVSARESTNAAMDCWLCARVRGAQDRLRSRPRPDAPATARGHAHRGSHRLQRRALQCGRCVPSLRAAGVSAAWRGGRSAGKAERRTGPAAHRGTGSTQCGRASARQCNAE